MEQIEIKKESNIFKKVVYLLKYIFKHWDRPPKNKFLGYREFAAYCVGGMGVFGATVIPTYISLTAGLYIAVALNIKIIDITIISIATNIISLLRAPLLSLIIDNTNSRIGKFRPWLVWLPAPILLSVLGLVFIPYALMSNYVLMLVAFTIFFNIMQFFIAIYSNAYNTLVLVISPSHEERTELMSIGSVIYSLGPSIVTILFPLLANLLYTTKGPNGEIAGINNIRSMQVILPIMLAICLAIGLFSAFGVKERFVQTKGTVNKVKFSEGLKSAAKNKYFWINTLSTIVGVFRMVATTYVVWIATYYIGTAWAQSILVTLAGSACVPGMLLAPLLIKKFGKKKVVIFTNLLCAVFTIPVVLATSVTPTVATPYIMYIFILLITLVNGTTVVLQPALSAMINDYQQYKTGKRIEGFLGQLSFVILTLIGIGTAFVHPAIFAAFGFTEGADVLYNLKDVTSPIIMWTCLIAVPSGLLSIVPFFFWDLTEKRHTSIMQVLAVRAKVGDGKISTEEGYELEARIESGEVNVLEGLFDEPLEEETVEETFTPSEYIKLEEQRDLERKEIKKNSTKEEWRAFLEEEKVKKQKEKAIRKQEALEARKRDKQLENENWELAKEKKHQEQEAKKLEKQNAKAEKETLKLERIELQKSMSKKDWKQYLAKEKAQKVKDKQARKEAIKQARELEKAEEKAFIEREKQNYLKEMAEEKATREEKRTLKENMKAEKKKQKLERIELKKSMSKEEWKAYNSKKEETVEKTDIE